MNPDLAYIFCPTHGFFFFEAERSLGIQYLLQLRLYAFFGYSIFLPHSGNGIGGTDPERDPWIPFPSRSMLAHKMDLIPPTLTTAAAAAVSPFESMASQHYLNGTIQPRPFLMDFEFPIPGIPFQYGLPPYLSASILPRTMGALNPVTYPLPPVPAPPPLFFSGSLATNPVMGKLAFVMPSVSNCESVNTSDSTRSSTSSTVDIAPVSAWVCLLPLFSNVFLFFVYRVASLLRFFSHAIVCLEGEGCVALML